MLNIYKIVVAVFLVTDKAHWVKFFEKTFLVANVGLQIVFKMLFLILSRADIYFLDWELRLWIYITQKVFATTKRIKLVWKKEFVTAALDSEYKIFVIYIASLSISSLNSILVDADIHLSNRPQIASLITKKAFTKINYYAIKHVNG